MPATTIRGIPCTTSVRVVSLRSNTGAIEASATLAACLPALRAASLARKAFAAGLELTGEDKPTAPALLEILNEREALVHVHEGRYHQVRRMFAAIGNNVEKLHREQVGSLRLDADLAPGEYRVLTAEQVALF